METPPLDNLSAAIQDLVRGQESAKMLRRLLTTQQVKEEADLVAGGQPVSAEVLVGDVLRSFTNVLSVLNAGEVSQVPVSISHSASESSKRDQRGSYKATNEERVQIHRQSLRRPLLTMDISGENTARKLSKVAIFPGTNYFRCTYKTDEGCLATKQVQMILEDPPIYRIFYHGDHTCRNLPLKPPQIVLDCPSPSRDFSILLSFNNNNNGGVGFPFSSTSCRSSTLYPQSMYQNYPSSDSSNYNLASLAEQGATEVHSSISYCSFSDSDLIDLEDVFSDD